MKVEYIALDLQIASERTMNMVKATGVFVTEEERLRLSNADMAVGIIDGKSMARFVMAELVAKYEMPERSALSKSTGEFFTVEDD